MFRKAAKKEKVRQQRQAVQSMWLRGYTKTEIARHFGKSLTWVNSRLAGIDKKK